jgi:hypothetical protein
MYGDTPFRYDFVFSNWIFVWFLLYFLRAVPFSPLLAMLTGLACNTYEYLSKQQEKSLAWRKNYLLWNIHIKILPVFFLLAYEHKFSWRHDLGVMTGVYLVFLGWVFVNGKMSLSNAMNPFNFNTKEQPLDGIKTTGPVQTGYFLQ